MSNTKNINFDNITFTGGYWKNRYELNRDVSIKSVRSRFEETARFEALRFTYKEGDLKPHVYFDSDVAKWIEAVSYLVKSGNDCKEELALCQELIDSMAKNQREDGYLNSYFQQIDPDGIFTRRGDHELYCAGHLLEAAIAYTDATGDTKFLDIMKKYMDCIEKAFIIEKTAKFSTPGHEELELALLKMYEYTSDKKYLDMAMFFINTRGTADEPLHKILDKPYDQNDKPLREITEAVGHAVRAGYIYIAMAEAGRLADDPELIAAAKRIFDNIISYRMYITGGIGASQKGEAFTVRYDLPNLEAYSESCAAISMMIYALAMQKYGIDAKYPAIIERLIYNGIPVSTAIDGKSFFYQNPLEIHLASVNKDLSMAPANKGVLPPRHRAEVFECSCCPPNINRIYARIGDVFLSESDDILIINQYAAMNASTDNANIVMKTDYPVNGKVSICISNCKYKKIYLRKPQWCDSYNINIDSYEKDGYIIVDAAANMEFEVDYNMTVYFAESHPSIRGNNGLVALCYGPTVYCLERLDNNFDLGALSVNIKEAISSATKIFTDDYLLPDIETDGYADEYFEGLYRKAQLKTNKTKLRFKPYWTFANREECDMRVWIRGL